MIPLRVTIVYRHHVYKHCWRGVYLSSKCTRQVYNSEISGWHVHARLHQVHLWFLVYNSVHAHYIYGVASRATLSAANPKKFICRVTCACCVRMVLSVWDWSVWASQSKHPACTMEPFVSLGSSKEEANFLVSREKKSNHCLYYRGK